MKRKKNKFMFEGNLKGDLTLTLECGFTSLLVDKSFSIKEGDRVKITIERLEKEKVEEIKN